jgi:hypothetical protein
LISLPVQQDPTLHVGSARIALLVPGYAMLLALAPRRHDLPQGRDMCGSILPACGVPLGLSFVGWMPLPQSAVMVIAVTTRRWITALEATHMSTGSSLVATSGKANNLSE